MINQIFDRISEKYEWGYTENPIPLSFSRFADWKNLGYGRSLKYLIDERFELRSDIRNIYPKFQSAIVLLFPYLDSVKKMEVIYSMPEWNGVKVASYSFAFDVYDYHFILKDRLNQLGIELKNLIPNIDYKLTVDTAPILERDLAYRSGLGFFGDNAHLINKRFGSYFLIGSILLTEKLTISLPTPLDKDCGHCTKCINKCPSEAIKESVDGSKCLSTFSIETFSDPGSAPLGHASEGFIFGCDICNQVCPWNIMPLSKINLDGTLSQREQFYADFLLLRPIPEIIHDLSSMSNREYLRLFKNTSFERTGRLGLLKNFRYYKAASK